MTQRIQQRLRIEFDWERHPKLMKCLFNFYPPYLGAGVKVNEIDFKQGKIVVSMPLTWLNQNIVGTQFGGSLYSMTDPFFMCLLMQKLGSDYVVWDKSGSIDFITAGTSTVTTTFMVDEQEVETIKQLAKEGKPVFREYYLDIVDAEQRIVAKVHKTVYIRRRDFSKSKHQKARI